MNFLCIVVLCAFFLSGYCQTCKPIPKKTSLDILATTSPIVVEILPIQSKQLKHPKKGTTFNVTAKVIHTFFHRNGGLTEGAEIQFGPVGRVKNCANLKAGNSKYLLFLQEPDQDGFYWIKYNPIKGGKRTLRKVDKVLCKRCLIPPSFKKKTKTLKKSAGAKLKIKCKAGGKPRPTLTWYHNDILLTKSNIPNDLKVKTKKKSSFLEISHVGDEYNGAKFKCSAKNIASDRSANYTITLKVKKVRVATCDKECDAKFANFCVHGHCCLETEGPRCLCNKGWDGRRCNERRVRSSIGDNKVENHKGQEHLAVTLGVCLTLMAVSFICLGTYCLFKRKRSEMLRKTWMVNVSEQTDASPMLTSYKNSAAESKNHFSTFTVGHANVAADSHKQSLQAKSTSDSTSAGLLSRHNSVTSSGFSQLDREHSRLAHKASLTKENGNSSMRSRLNGLAKNNTRRSTSKTTDHTLSITAETLAQQQALTSCLNPNKGSDSKSSLCHHESHIVPALPLNSGLLSIVKHQSNISTVPPTPPGVDQLAKSDIHSSHPFPPTSTYSSKVMSTFDTCGDVQQKPGAQSKPSSVITQSIISLSKNTDNSDGASMPESLPYKNTSSQSGADTRIVESDQEDPFVGLKIPDASLSLYDDTPHHSLKKTKGPYSDPSSNAVYCPEQLSRVPCKTPSFASAHLLRLPMLSKQAIPTNDTGAPISPEPLLCNDTSFSETEFPERLV